MEHYVIIIMAFIVITVGSCSLNHDSFNPVSPDKIVEQPSGPVVVVERHEIKVTK